MKSAICIPLLALGLFLQTVQAQNPIPFHTAFSPDEGYEQGSADGQNGWKVEQGKAVIGDHHGVPALIVPPSDPFGQVSVYFKRPLPGQPVFLDFQVRMGARPESEDFVDANGSSAALVRIDSGGALVARHSSPEGVSWIDTGIHPAMDESGFLGEALHLTIRQDPTAGTWDLYVNGKIAGANFGLDPDPRESGGYFSLMGDNDHETVLSTLWIDSKNMLFEDADGDGLPDSWQASLTLGGRDDDGDLDGLINMEEYVLGTSPVKADTDGDGVTDTDELRLGTDPHKADAEAPAALIAEFRMPGAADFDEFPASLEACRTADILQRPLTSFTPLKDLEFSGILHEHFLTRVRGWITVPVTGDYPFWISGDDQAELWLSSDTFAGHRKRIAHCPDFTSFRQFDLYPAQRSAPVRLEVGQRYYIEVLHRNSGGMNHFSVAWQIPGGKKAIVSSTWLKPWTPDPEDLDDDGLPDSWQNRYQLMSRASNGSLHRTSGPWADPDGDHLSNLDEYRLGSDPDKADAEGRTGLITQEGWHNIPGRYLFDVAGGTFPGAPQETAYLDCFESLMQASTNYVARLRGFVTVPATGTYRFHIAADDQAELYLGTSADKFSKKLVASAPLFTAWRDWNRYAAQTSQPMQLSKGQVLYIEALQKQGLGQAHLSVGWTVPGAESPAIIGGQDLTSWKPQANDSDGNELPDSWQATHRLTPSDGTPASFKETSAWGDADHDGITNGAELAAGTDPSDPLSRPNTGLQWQIWQGLPGMTLDLLPQLTSYPANPSRSQALVQFDYGTQGDNYLSRVRGIVTAPVTGTYVFSLAANNETRLYLSRDASRFNKTVIAQVALASPWRNKDWNKWQESTPVDLVAGKKYYIETIQKAGLNEDFLAVGWNVPGFGQSIISAEFLSPLPADPEDRDDDDLPDPWEKAHGLNSSNPSGADGAWGDPDGDLLSNFDEFQHGTDPLKADTTKQRGLALWEVWDGITGLTIDKLTGHPRFPSLPDRKLLLSSAEMPPDRGTWYGGRLRGYLVPPVSGKYKLLVSGDDQAALYVSTGEGKFERKFVAGAPFWTGERQFDRYPEQAADLTLKAGKSYYFELLHKADSGHNNATLAWIPPGGKDPVIPAGMEITAFTIDPADLDDDELPDEWEMAYKLDPRDNGNTMAVNGYWGDPDRDGLANIDEWRLGTNPRNKDTDSDGLDDGLEVNLAGTNPLQADASPLGVFATGDTKSLKTVSGSWEGQADLLISGQSGSADWPFSLAQAGRYFFRVSGAGVPLLPDAQDEITIVIDGLSLGSFPLTSGSGLLGVAMGRMPFLSAGAHTLQVRWASPRADRRLALSSLEILSFASSDGSLEKWNANDQAANHVTERPRESLTSPVCLEGTALFPSLVKLSDKTPVHEGPDRTWFANVALPADDRTLSLQASFENGASLGSAELVWKPLNILEGGSLTLRKGDAVRLAAYPAGNAGPIAGGQVTFRINGEATAREESAIAVEHVFAAAGVYEITADYVDNSGRRTGTFTVTTVEADLPQEIVVFAGRPRVMTFSGIPREVDLIADSSLYWSLRTPGPPPQVRVQRATPGLASVIARLPDGGAILDSAAVRAVALKSSVETSLSVVGQSADGTTIIQMDVFLPDIPEGTRVLIEIAAAGVTFEDGSVSKWLTKEDFDTNGVAKVKFVRAPGVETSICHIVSLWQGEEMIGTY